MRRKAWLVLLCMAVELTIVHSQTGEGKSCKDYMDFILLLDSSESIRDNAPDKNKYLYWDLMVEYTENILKELEKKTVQTNVAVLQFASYPHVSLPLSSNFQFNSSSLAPVGGNTNTKKALEDAGSMLFSASGRHGARKVVLVVSDGLSNNLDEVFEFAEHMKQSGIEMFSVAVSEFIDRKELIQLASDPQDHFYLHLRDYSVLKQLVTTTVKNICETPKIDCTLDGISDLAILMDNSGSLKLDPNSGEWNITAYGPPPNYQTLKNFTKSLIDLLDTGPNRTQVAVMRFSDHPKKEFDLNQYINNKTAMKNAIDAMGYDNGYTNIADTLNETRNDIFTIQNGDRPSVRNVILIITDGSSTVNVQDTIPQASLTKDANITIFVIGILTEEINDDELRAIASSPAKIHYFRAISFEHLDTLKDRLLNKVCLKKKVIEITTPTSTGDGKKPKSGADTGRLSSICTLIIALIILNKSLT